MSTSKTGASKRALTPSNLPKGKPVVEVVSEVNGNGRILKWQPVWFCQEYNIKYGSTVAGEHKIVERFKKTSFLVPENFLEHEVTYFAVQGWNAAGGGEWSEWVPVKKPVTPVAPLPPVILPPPIRQEPVKKEPWWDPFVTTILVLIAIPIIIFAICASGWFFFKMADYWGWDALAVTSPPPVTHTKYVYVDRYVTNNVVATTNTENAVDNFTATAVIEFKNTTAPPQPPPAPVTRFSLQLAHPYLEGEGWARVALVVNDKDPKVQKDALKAPDGAPAPLVTSPSGTPIAVERLRIRRGNEYFSAWGTRNPPPWAIPEG